MRHRKWLSRGPSDDVVAVMREGLDHVARAAEHPVPRPDPQSVLVAFDPPAAWADRSAWKEFWDAINEALVEAGLDDEVYGGLDEEPDDPGVLVLADDADRSYAVLEPLLLAYPPATRVQLDYAGLRPIKEIYLRHQGP